MIALVGLATGVFLWYSEPKFVGKWAADNGSATITFKDGLVTVDEHDFGMTISKYEVINSRTVKFFTGSPSMRSIGLRENYVYKGVVSGDELVVSGDELVSWDRLAGRYKRGK